MCFQHSHLLTSRIQFWSLQSLLPTLMCFCTFWSSSWPGECLPLLHPTPCLMYKVSVKPSLPFLTMYSRLTHQPFPVLLHTWELATLSGSHSMSGVSLTLLYSPAQVLHYTVCPVLLTAVGGYQSKVDIQCPDVSSQLCPVLTSTSSPPIS